MKSRSDGDTHAIMRVRLKEIKTKLVSCSVFQYTTNPLTQNQITSMLKELALGDVGGDGR